MDGLYSYEKPYYFSSDDDDVVDVCVTPTSSTHLSGSKNKYRSNERCSFTHEPVRSKYNYHPRNVILGEEGFSLSSRRSEVGMSGGNGRRYGLYDRLNSDGVHLGDEVKGCMDESNDQTVGFKGQVVGFKGQVDEAKGHVEASCTWFLWWLGKMEWWRVLVLGGVVGVIFCTIYQGGLNGGLYMGLFYKDNLLECQTSRVDQPCLAPTQLQSALQLAGLVLPQLHRRAGDYCGDQPAQSKAISITELKKLLPTELEGRRTLQDFIYLILYNPHWNIIWLDEQDLLLSDWQLKPMNSNKLQSTSPSRTISCSISKFLAFMWHAIRWLLLIAVGVALLGGGIVWYAKVRKEERRLKFVMVDRILNMLKKHFATTKRKNNLLPYLAVIHVRDMLIAPSERRHKLKIWQGACDWIAKYESRVRLEHQRIAGEDFEVWRWIQEEMTPHTEEPFSTAELPAKPLVVEVGKVSSSSREKNWYSGTTFDDDTGRNTGRNNRLNSPHGSPSSCIRLKNMFETVKHMSDEQSKEIENSVLDRCIPHGGVVHIYVDRRGIYGCVYLKMESLESAIGAYQALHGGWYKGKLVTAKYIPPEKYHKWFPVAINAKALLQPSC